MLDDVDELMQRAAHTVSERFGLQHVNLFLVDESEQWAVLRAAAGNTDRHMLVRGYRVEVGDPSTVGQCTANAEVCTAPTTGRSGAGDRDTTWPGVPSVPGPAELNRLTRGTRSEMALPMRAGGRIIGALKVESTERDPFSQEDVAILQTVADQIAVAVENAQAFARARAQVEEMEEHLEHSAHTQGLHVQPTQPLSSYERTRPHEALAHMPASSMELDPGGQAVETAAESGNGAGQARLVVPISLRGQMMGALGVHETGGQRAWTQDEIALVEAVADQMALAIENARLLNETQQRAEREQALSEVTTRFTRSLDIDTLLQTAVRELGQLLQADEISVYLGTPPAEASQETGESVSGEAVRTPPANRPIESIPGTVPATGVEETQ